MSRFFQILSACLLMLPGILHAEKDQPRSADLPRYQEVIQHFFERYSLQHDEQPCRVCILKGEF